MFNAYSVSVRLKLANWTSAGLGVIAGELGTLNRRVGVPQSGFDALHGKMLKIRNMGLLAKLERLSEDEDI